MEKVKKHKTQMPMLTNSYALTEGSTQNIKINTHLNKNN